MQVFVVLRDEEDWDSVIGVYSTRASAAAAVKLDRDEMSPETRLRMDQYTLVPCELEN